MPRTRINTSDISEIFDGQQVTGGNPLQEVEITPDMRKSANVREPGIGRAKEVASRQHGMSGRIRRAASSAKETLGDVGDVLAQPSVQVGLGQFAQAFGQGDPTSPATILGEASQQMGQQAAEAEVMQTLLSGGDVSQIPAETLASAGEGARTQLINIHEQREDRKLSEEALEQRTELQQRGHDLQERGLDLRAVGLSHDIMRSEMETEEIERRLNVAETNAETQRMLAESSVDYREAQVNNMRAQESGEQVDYNAVIREGRHLIDSFDNRLQSLERQRDLLEADLGHAPEGDPEHGFIGRTARSAAHYAGRSVPFSGTAAGDVTDAWRESQPTEEQIDLRGRIALLNEEIEDITQARQQVIDRNNSLIQESIGSPVERGVGEAGGDTGEAETDQEIAPGSQDIVDISDPSDAHDYEDDTILRFEGELYQKKEGNLIRWR